MPTQRLLSSCLSLLLGLGLVACEKKTTPTVDPEATDKPVGAEKPAFPDLDSVLAAAHRSDENKVRDPARHPKQTLEFFGIQRNMTVVELWPGGGWYTEILGPYLRDEGKLIVTNLPATHERYGARAKAYEEGIKAKPELYGDVVFARGHRRSRRHLPQQPRLAQRRHDRAHPCGRVQGAQARRDLRDRPAPRQRGR
jgi:predicted methyltransferase